MRKLRLMAILAALSMLVLLVGAPASAGPPERTYEVTIENLTPDPGVDVMPGIPTDGQPFTPALVATHKGSDGFFKVGKEASFGLQQIAENGYLDPMYERVSDDDDFVDVVIQTGENGPILPGETITLTITAAPPFNFLSWASMLICTNDGFTGVDSLKLPNQVGQSVHAYTAGYDAGTEVNTEDFADMVPPCQVLSGVSSDDAGTGMTDPGLAEDGVIHHHPGIEGEADLDPAIHGWDDPVAKIVITRTD